MFGVKRVEISLFNYKPLKLIVLIVVELIRFKIFFFQFVCLKDIIFVNKQEVIYTKMLKNERVYKKSCFIQTLHHFVLPW